MNDFRNRFSQFMTGRYGMDETYLAMLAVYAVLAIINLFVRSRIISLIMWAWLILAFLRFFSKNLPARERENAFLLSLVSKIRNKDFSRDPFTVKAKKESKIKKKFNKYSRMFKERKTHVFKDCPSCGATIRLPRKKGTHTVCCPKCSRDFEVKIH